MEILTTKRLRLRNFYEEESEELLKFYLDPEIGKYMYWGQTSEADISYLIKHSQNRSLLDNGAYAYAVSYLKSDNLVGEIFLEKRASEFILGYAIKPSKQGHGYANEILTSLIARIYELYPEMNILALVDKNNKKSRALLLKLGFINDLYQLESSPFVIYSLYGPLK